MNLAKQINQKLDELHSLYKMQGILEANKEDLRFKQKIEQAESELNSITNNGQNVIDIFTNKYYINDTMQDREIAKEENK